ncbi:hypothetical protein VC74_gp30 [Mycobacterium phage Sparky]|uniref:Uncharacterized protein n=1 Tax=Mycobacterium phage Sparky TaxID=1527493 RepID=A0A076G982_9CAUD|nr:hypothetical protein VC74_gp30 [Mycobacterium phage Sparky]AII28178.1 hypothetical protein PBI_SPARKY_30 [Mycobacterium phage Sparky]
MSEHERALMSQLPPWILLVVAVLVLIAYTLPRIAEASSTLAKLMGPIGRYWRRRGRVRAQERDAELQAEAKELAKLIVQEVTPPDYAEMGRRLANMERRVLSLEESDQIQRAFIVYDEEWHFNDALSAVGRPDCAPAPRLTHNQFKRYWRAGWRPGDPIPDD